MVASIVRGVSVRQRPVRVLQIGGGNFLRGFADWMIQKGNDAGFSITAWWC